VSTVPPAWEISRASRRLHSHRADPRNVSSYSLEMATPCHEHEWRVWEVVKLPDDKVLIPGVISHATNVVE
jgi:hypothetical protein